MSMNIVFPDSISRRSRTVLLALVSLCVLQWPAPGAAVEDPGSCAANLHRPFAHPGALGAEFEVLSWNIKKAGDSHWSEDLSRLAAASDLVFIQEASLQAGIPSALDRINAEAFAPGYRTSTLDTGVMTLSAGAPSLHCRFTAMEPWLGTPKATSVTEHVLDGRDYRLLAINLHAVNFALGLKDFESQFASIGTVLEQHNGPVVLAGDLNTWSASRQTLVDDFMSRYGLKAVHFEPDLRTRAFGYALDHVYIRGLSAKAATVIPVESSDHNPLQVRLRLGT